MNGFCHQRVCLFFHYRDQVTTFKTQVDYSLTILFWINENFIFDGLANSEIQLKRLLFLFVLYPKK